MLSIEAAIDLLKQNEVVVIPTETVYGLAANIYSNDAVKKIFELKGRPLTNPLIVHIAAPGQLTNVATDIPGIAWRLAEAFWPGPLTLVLPKAANISPLITAGGPSVAVRMPNHPVALELLQQLPFPLAAPSANPSNYLSPTSPNDVIAGFPHLANRIINGGQCQKGIESTVVGFHNGGIVLYRYGAVPINHIEAVAGVAVKFAKNITATAPSPGMLKKHYSPRTPLVVTNHVTRLLEQQPQAVQIGVLSFKNRYQHPQIAHQMVLSPTGNAEEAAHHLFAYLHQLDRRQLSLIIAELLPPEGLGLAVNDRLYRAAES